MQQLSEPLLAVKFNNESAPFLVFIDGKDKSKDISKIEFYESYKKVKFKNSDKKYIYKNNRINVFLLKEKYRLSDVIISSDALPLSNMEFIFDYGEFFKIQYADGSDTIIHKDKIHIEKNILSEPRAAQKFKYFSEVAKNVSLISEFGNNILYKQYQKIKKCSKSSILSKFLLGETPYKYPQSKKKFIFPFGTNISQMKAVKNAFSAQISLIQGPPGTGKTQTILSVIANILLNGKNVAVVSNNNSAIENIKEKLEKYDLSFLCALLGSVQNRNTFIKNQKGDIPKLPSLSVLQERKEKERLTQITEKIFQYFQNQEELSVLEGLLHNIKTETRYLEQEFSIKESPLSDRLSRLSSQKIFKLWKYCHKAKNRKHDNIFDKFIFFIYLNINYFKFIKTDFIQNTLQIQNAYYKSKLKETIDKIISIRSETDFLSLKESVTDLKLISEKLLKSYLKLRYKKDRKIYKNEDIDLNFKDFISDYPIILSTMYSLRNLCPEDFLFDYIIVDEASQADIVTGVLVLSCANNIIIVGDTLQLKNVVNQKNAQINKELIHKYQMEDFYNYETHSFLSSVEALWHDVPSVILKEHYRCQPQIINFCNKKFYNDNLIIMTKQRDDTDTLKAVKSVKGNHARRHLNQRQIDIIKYELLPKLADEKDIGIITPYREQAEALKAQLPDYIEADTVHKFQGREKSVIILSTVDNAFNEFLNDPNLLNVAVSRATRKFWIIYDNDVIQNGSNIGDLIQYIKYNNFEILDSKTISIFDILYKQYKNEREIFISKSKIISKFLSENLVFNLLNKILSQQKYHCFDFAFDVRLKHFIKISSEFSPEEKVFIENNSHTDFLIYNKINKLPLLAVEVDGYFFHMLSAIQKKRDKIKDSVLKKSGIKLLRLATTGSSEQARIEAALDSVYAPR